ncbi:MAG: dihydroxyacetone kinase subunit DhaK [Lachnospiraceae bacterium]|nr:dihydroxyacetone kinase subunit DhaK [Lachnospiraceae bacterium]
MKMKKFINSQETVTDEELTGLGLAYSEILDVEGHMVISKKLADADRVTVVTYGGSGHEPAQAGYVGEGMLDIQVVGDIFAAPSGKLVFEALQKADKGHGVLLLTLNYAGDQLAGKQAMKLAKKAGMNVRQVITDEEIKYDPEGEDNKRGLAGAVAMYHIVGAAAAQGKSLDEVAEIGERYAKNMASLTIKVSDATHPQNGQSFGDLGETDLMEIGAGQHGEGGGVRVPMMSSKETVATVGKALVDSIGLKSGDKAFVMINGCGATTMMEMLILYKDTVEYLKGLGVEVVANMVGEILTVQEAGGFQLNIAKWDDEFLSLWNTKVHTPALSREG